jgi:hypothetical protein
MANEIKIKSSPPKKTEFSNTDLVVDIKNGHLYFKSNLRIHKLSDAAELTAATSELTSQIAGISLSSSQSNLTLSTLSIDTPTGSGLYMDNSHLGYYDGGDWSTFMSSSGNFYLGGDNGSLIWDHDTNTLSVTGHIQANTGLIGGFTINATSLSASNFIINTLEKKITLGSSNNIFIVDADTGMHLGHANFANAPFSVTKGGALKSTSGHIGGFSIGADALTATDFALDNSARKITLGSSNNIFIVDADTGMHLGHANFANAPFSVTREGVLKAQSGVIGGFGITADAITGSQFFLSGSATGNQFFISSSKFNVKASGEITGSAVLLGDKTSGNYLEFINDTLTVQGDITVDNIRTPATIGGSPSTVSNASSSINSDGFARFASASIADFDIINSEIKSTNENLRLKSTGEITGSKVLFTGGKIGSFALSTNALSGINSNTNSTTFFISSSVDTISPEGVAFFVSSSKFNIRQDGTVSGSKVLFDGGKIGGFTIDSTKITGTNIVIDSAGSLQTSNYVSDLTGWKISAANNGFAEFENAKIRGTLSTTVFEKQSVNAVGGQLYIANSTILTGSGEAGASPDGQYTATQTTMSVENVTGFEHGEILTLKKFSSTGFATEYISVNSASRADVTSDTNFSGRLYVTRSIGVGVLGNSSSLGETPATGQSYSGSQVIVSTGKTGTGFIRINANPNDQATPYMDIVERTGSGIYDVELKARLGDLSGLANSSYVFGSSNPGFGLATDNVFLQGGIIANTGSIGGIKMQESKLFTGTGTYNDTNTGFYLDASSNFSLGNKLSWNGTTLAVTGDITVSNPDSFYMPNKTRASYKLAYIDSGSVSAKPAAEGYTMGSFFSSSLGYVGGNFGTTLIATNAMSDPDAVPGNTWFSVVTGSTKPADIAGYATNGYDLFVAAARGYGTNSSAEATRILNLFDEGNSVLIWGNGTTTVNATGSHGTEWPIKAYQLMGYNTTPGSHTGSYATSSIYDTGLHLNNPILQGWGPVWSSAEDGPLEDSNPPTRLYSDGGATTVVPIAARNIAANGDLRTNTTAQYLAWYATNPRGGRMVCVHGPYDAYNFYTQNPIASERIIDFLLKKDLDQEAYQSGITKITGDMIQTGLIQSTNYGSSAGSEFNLNSGTFKLGGSNAPKLSWNGTTLAVTGEVSADTGRIGGFGITADAITGSQFFLSGSATGNQFFISSSKFNIKASGDITASSALFTGQVKAQSFAEYIVTVTAENSGSYFQTYNDGGALTRLIFDGSQAHPLTPYAYGDVTLNLQLNVAPTASIGDIQLPLQSTGIYGGCNVIINCSGVTFDDTQVAGNMQAMGKLGF